jgi:glyoxalase family protein
VLGLRLVKRTINFDDPGSYHFYFGDERGSPGTILTFFPWPGARRGHRGTGQIEATAFAIASESVGFWLVRLKQHGIPAEKIANRFGEDGVRFIDPDGLLLELIASHTIDELDSGMVRGVPAEHSLRGFHSVSAAVRNYEPTAVLLTDLFGYHLAGEKENRFRFVSASAGPAGIFDLLRQPEGGPGAIAVGSVHHVAFRVRNDEEQLQWRERLLERGFSPTPVIDRTYFHSIYFREPGGILFEIATDPPGFAVDETPDELGSKLCLPSWMESARAEIEKALPPIKIPTSQAAN